MQHGAANYVDSGWKSDETKTCEIYSMSSHEKEQLAIVVSWSNNPLAAIHCTIQRNMGNEHKLSLLHNSCNSIVVIRKDLSKIALS